MKKKITRRELLKLIFLQFPIAYFSSKNQGATFIRHETVEESSDILLKIPADRLPVIEYHYPGYRDEHVTITDGMFIEQIKFLTETKTKTLKDQEYIDFIKGKGFTPANSAVIRINQGSAHFKEFTKMINMLKTKGLHAIVFLAVGEQFTDIDWDNLVHWYQEGIISIGSHAYSHPDFTKISAQSALDEAILSKKHIEEKFHKRGAHINIRGFAFPSDRVPQDVEFLIQAGYEFAFGGNINGSPQNNAVRVGDFVAPSLLPYVSNETLKLLDRNSRNNPRSIPLTCGYTFDKLIYFASTPVTPEKIMNVTRADYPEIKFGNYYSILPIPPEDTSLVKPSGFIIHTDGQSLERSNNWRTLTTYYGLLSRQTNVHFSCGIDGIRQLLPMYKDFIVPSRGAPGFSNYIQIEMCGTKYDAILSGQIKNEEIRNTIEMILSITANLVVALIIQYKITTCRILGHHQACASGKVDPGDISINYLIDKVYQILQKKLRMDLHQSFIKPQ